MEEKRKWCVYCHTNKINGKKYIGITCQNPHRRWGKNGIHYKYQNFYKAINKYGWDGFEHDILHRELSEKEAKIKEKYYININNTKSPNGYNLTDGGDGSAGFVVSEETRKKLRESHLGQVAWNKGISYESHRTSDAQLKLWESEEYRKRMSDAHIGIKHTEETKRKISENSARLVSIYQIDKNTREVLRDFGSIKEAIHILNLKTTDSASISSSCSGRIKGACGYIWMYKLDYDNKNELYHKMINMKFRSYKEKYESN